MTQYEKDLEMVKRMGSLLQQVKTQTPEICMAAVKQDGRALQHVKTQTLKLCTAAVSQNGFALEFVKNQTPELCMTAVRKTGYALEYVKIQTPELCLEAVKQDVWILEYVNPDLMCSDLYLLGLRDIKSENIVKLVSSVIGKKLDKQNILGRIDNIRKGIEVLDILRSDMGYLQFINPDTLMAEDYHEVLDYIIESGIELTEYQKEHINRLDRKI